MDCFEELRAVAIDQNMRGNFPDWLLREVLEIADAPDVYGRVIPSVETLAAQIRDYDPYAGSGCFDSSVSAGTIEMTISRIRSQGGRG